CVMTTLLRTGLFLLLLSSLGCAGSSVASGEPGDPEAGDVLLAHFDALHRRDWRRAYEFLHRDLKSSGFTLKRFTALYDKRLKMQGAPEKIEVRGSEQTGDDVVVSFDVCAVPASGGEPVAVPPRRKATLRKSGGSWGLLAHDILTVRQ